MGDRASNYTTPGGINIKGIFLREPHGRLLFEGHKKLIIKSEPLDVLGKDFLLCAEKRCYGKINFTKMRKLNKGHFRSSEAKHKITNAEKDTWWPGAKEFYGYWFDFIPFATPKPIDNDNTSDMEFVREVIFLEAMSLSKIKSLEDIDGYNPVQMSDNGLRNDWNITAAWYASWKSGHLTEITSEQIFDLSTKIFTEMKKRGLKPQEGDLANYITSMDFSLSALLPSGNEYDSEVALDDIMHHFRSFKTQSPSVYIVGGLVANGKTKGDIDILVRQKEKNVALETRIFRQLPRELWERLHFIYDIEHSGPFSDFVALYDQSYELISPFAITEMEEEFEPQFKPPESGDAPQGVKDILLKVYSNCRAIWVKDHPGDKENKANKELCARIAWSAVKKAGWRKGSDGKWISHMEFDIQVTDRYRALGISEPNIKTMCRGQCEGTGYVPIHRDETEPVFKKLWEVAEANEPTDDGYHFVTCPDCEGIGKALKWALQSNEGHDHIADLNNEGNGESSEDDGHRHPIHAWSVIETDNHTHELDRMEAQFMVKPFGSPGGKHFQTKMLRALIPPHRTFVEVFAGGASLFFAKEPSEREALNDKDKDIATSFRAIKALTPEKIEAMKKKDWAVTKPNFEIVKNMEAVTDDDILYKHLYLTFASYFGTKTDISKQKMEQGRVYKSFPRLQKAADRLKNTTIHNEDWISVIQKYDAPDTFFYLDPPYARSSGKKSKDKLMPGKWAGLVRPDEMIKTLKAIRGKFLCSFTIKDGAAKIFKGAGFTVKKVKVKRARTAPLGGGTFFDYEIVISNYELKNYSQFEDEMKPFTIFKQMKPTHGVRKNEAYNIRGIIDVIRQHKNFYPALIDEKFDGMRAQIHKKGSKVRMWSEEGNEVTHRFPIIIKELSKNKYAFILDAEITGWTGGYKKGEPIGRADVSGYVHMKGQPDDDNFYVNIFDAVYFNGDIHELPQWKRREVVNDLSKDYSEKHIKFAPIKVADNDIELIEAVKFFSNESGSEGAMIKSATAKYELDGATKNWYKFKNEFELDAIVVSKKAVKGSKSFNYLCAIMNLKGELIPVGNTFNTDINVPVGDILRVAFQNLNRYHDKSKDKIWYNWFSPRPLEHRTDKKRPDHTGTADRIVKASKGEIDEKPYPSRYAGLLDKKTNAEFADPFLIKPLEDSRYRFVLQAHIRGRSVHLDDRRQITDTHAVGMTHFMEEGLSREPTSFRDAIKLLNSELLPLIKSHLRDPNKKLLSVKKSLIPIKWLTIKGKLDIDEPGSTKHKPGYMIILDAGEIQYGALKSHFHEYFYNGKKGLMFGRYVDVLIEDKKNWKKIGDGEIASWLFFKADSGPYTISSRAVNKNWMPPGNNSALPRNVRKNIPAEYRYWDKSSPAERKKVRDELVKAMKKKDVKIKVDYESGEFGHKLSVSFSLTDSKEIDGGLWFKSMLFHRGLIKGYWFTDDNLKRAKLVPYPGKALSYVNWYHLKGEEFKIGILTKVFYDPNHEWFCLTEQKWKKGALMAEGVVTNKDAIREIKKKKEGTYQISGEIKFARGEFDGNPMPMDIDVNGMCITDSPACKECGMTEAHCGIDGHINFPTPTEVA